jgi:hypothetical protein
MQSMKGKLKFLETLQMLQKLTKIVEEAIHFPVTMMSKLVTRMEMTRLVLVKYPKSNGLNLNCQLFQFRS